MLMEISLAFKSSINVLRYSKPCEAATWIADLTSVVVPSLDKFCRKGDKYIKLKCSHELISFYEICFDGKRNNNICKTRQFAVHRQSE